VTAPTDEATAAGGWECWLSPTSHAQRLRVPFRNRNEASRRPPPALFPPVNRSGNDTFEPRAKGRHSTIPSAETSTFQRYLHNKFLAGAIGWASIALIFYVDHVTGDEYRFTILYQIAVVFFAWYFDLWYVIFVCIVCSVLRVLSNVLANDPYPSIDVPILNSLTRFTTYFLTAFIMLRFKRELLAQRDTNQKLSLANDEILRLAQIKSDFTSMVSHELRTPLMVIKEGISIVGEGAAGPVNDEQLDYLDTAKRNVDRLSRLINDVLDFQKLDSAHMAMTFSLHDLNDIVQTVADGFKAIADKKGLKIETNLQTDLPRIVLDKDRIEQVLVNLINNAITFTNKGRILLSSSKMDNAVRVSIRDEGIGIRKEDIGRLFQSFSQLSSGTERRTGGSGLGLAISRKIIELHRGTLRVESTVGQGSTFYLVLPIVERRN